MADKVSPEQRSAMMSRVRGQDTKPELAVRQALHSAGFRYRLHRKDLPGRPDVVLSRYRVAVFVHGCFWHGHHCPRGRRPSSNETFWAEKLDRNATRDADAARRLREMGWDVVTIWECSVAAATEDLVCRLRGLRSVSRLS